VCIYENTLLSFSENEAKIRVSCSSGTYIRTLAHDIGQKLGCGAYLSDLVRTQIEDIPLSQCVSLEDADFHHFFSPRNILPFPEYEVNTKEYEDLAHGKSITPSHSFSQNYISIVKDNIFYGVAFYNETYNKLQAKKIIPPNLPLLP
jgi:tRNA pseudouridine55 synthase